MLDPQDRSLLYGQLRPPEGYGLDYALATTYSLDLLSLLAAPIALARFDWEGSELGERPDPLMALESLRRCSDKVAVFCEAGRIAVPSEHQTLFAMLEPMVHEVRAPTRDRVFHPKVWVIRFVGSEKTVRYRLLVLSRNLTADNSWDTIVSLDGELVERRNAFRANHPLADFVSVLPRLCLQRPGVQLQRKIDTLARELRKVRFTLPEGFTRLAFWPMGIERHMSWPFDRAEERLLVISPFVEPGCLKRLTSAGEGHVLVSRPEELDAISREGLKPFKRVFVLPAEGDRETADDDVDAAAGERFKGLHAKVYVADAGRHGRIWLGSANATNAAFNGNVEFLLELEGARSKAGVDAVLQRSKDRTGLLDLLEEYAAGREAAAADSEEERLKERLDRARRAIADARMTAVATGVEDGLFGLCLLAPEVLTLPIGVSGRCWPITQREDTAAEPIGGSGPCVADFGRMTFEGLTSFVAFALEAREADRRLGIRFVLNLRLEGAPTDRPQLLLRAMLCDRAHVSRLLLLLLADEGDGEAVRRAIDPLFDGHDQGTSAGRLEAPLLETLLRALHRRPERLDSIAELISQLGPDGGARQLLPDGFERIWGPIWAARQAGRE